MQIKLSAGEQINVESVLELLKSTIELQDDFVLRSGLIRLEPEKTTILPSEQTVNNKYQYNLIAEDEIKTITEAELKAGLREFCLSGGIFRNGVKNYRKNKTKEAK